jgi:hypothetical protein
MNTCRNNIRKEIVDFISVSERIQGIMAMGEELSRDEIGLIRLCANDLLEKVPDPLDGLRR